MARAQFTEPTPVSTNLPIPITTSSAAQTIDAQLGIGVSNPDQIPVNSTLFVKGDVMTRDGSARDAEALIQGADNPFQLKRLPDGSSQVQIGAACPGDDPGSKICVTTTDGGSRKAALAAVHNTGNAIFGETAGVNRAGVYGEGYYGVYGFVEAGAPNSIAIVGQSCDESFTGDCIQGFYGSAGYFKGDFVIANGILEGDGRKIYGIRSLWNQNLDRNGDGNVEVDETGTGIRYASWKVEASGELLTLDTGRRNIVGITAVERLLEPADMPYTPAGRLVSYSLLQTDGADDQITYQVVSGSAAVEVIFLVQYFAD
ncbi:MAG: hypothetical protein WC547_04475 [Candidatus Omnitrophota bacterium]